MSCIGLEMELHPLTLLVLCLAVHCLRSWHRSLCSLHTLCRPCTGPASTCACLAGTSCSSLPSLPARPLGLHPWLWPCSPHRMLKLTDGQVLHFAQNKNSKGIYKPQCKVCFYVYLSSYLSLPGSWIQCLCHIDPCCSPQTSTLRHSWSEHMYGPYPWQPELQSDLSDPSPDL